MIWVLLIIFTGPADQGLGRTSAEFATLDECATHIESVHKAIAVDWPFVSVKCLPKAAYAEALQ